MTDRPTSDVLVHADADRLAVAVATRLVHALTAAQAGGREPAVALTGGSIAERIHRAVLEVPAHRDVDWNRVDLWFGDERYVPARDGDRNAGQAQEALLDRLPVDPERVHTMPASDGQHRDLGSAAAAYDRELRAAGFGSGTLFDVVMLGVGPDGHVASLFPGSPALDVRDALAVGVPGSPKPPAERISLTFGALNRAREVWFVVSGAEKAEAVARAFTGADPREIPAAGVRGREQTWWFLDEASASRLAG